MKALIVAVLVLLLVACGTEIEQENAPPQVEAFICPEEVTLGKSRGTIIELGQEAVVEDEDSDTLEYQWEVLTPQLGRYKFLPSSQQLDALICVQTPGEWRFRLLVSDLESAVADTLMVTVK